jgi:hypothetical protein
LHTVGPEEEEPELRSDGWDSRAALEVSERRAQEIEQVRGLQRAPQVAARPDQGRRCARELLVEINEALHRGLSEREAVFDDGFLGAGSYAALVRLDAELRRVGDHQGVAPPGPE